MSRKVEHLLSLNIFLHIFDNYDSLGLVIVNRTVRTTERGVVRMTTLLREDQTVDGSSTAAGSNVGEVLTLAPDVVLIVEQIPDQPVIERSRPSLEQVVDAIVAEFKVKAKRARKLVNMLDNAARWERAHDYQGYIIPEWDMDAHHELLAMVLPDDVIPEPGTSGHMLQEYLIRPDLGEYGFVHTEIMDADDNFYCGTRCRIHRVGA